jgi:ubiquinone/menaquinone biosynthesis C-methylase UbiE
MADTPGDDHAAGGYRTVREVPPDDLAAWREAVALHLDPRRGMTVLDVGAGTGVFAIAFADWFGVEVLAIEPSAAMRAQIPTHPAVRILDGRAECLPVLETSADGAWLSRVTHHAVDLAATATDLRRALRPGARVLIREVFPERCDRRPLVRFFPETRRKIDTYPTLEQTCVAFTAAGFEQIALQVVSQPIASTLAEFARCLRRDADGLLRQLSDQEFARGLNRLRVAVRAETAGDDTDVPLLDYLDLLVLK